jgi:hypothetical protein
MLGGLGSKNPLAPWAKQLLVSVARPDNRRRGNRERIQEARQREKKQREEEWKREEEGILALEESWARLDQERLAHLRAAS